MSKPVVLVIGCGEHNVPDGGVGVATVAVLSEKYADQVEIKAGVCNPEKASQFKVFSNVEIIQATLGDSGLVNTLKGVDILYVAFPSIELGHVQKAISTVKFAKEAGVKHFVIVSAAIADVADTFYGQEFQELETEIDRLGVSHTCIRVPIFAENYWNYKSAMVTQGAMIRCTDPDVPFACATIEDVAKASAVILVNPDKYCNQKLMIVSNIHSLNEFLKELSSAIGKEIKYVRVSYEDVTKSMIEQGFDERFTKAALQMSKLIDEANPAMTQGDVEVYKKLTGEQPTCIKDWVAKHCEGFKC